MLTRQDLDTLIEAVEAWEREDAFGDMMGDMLTSLVCRDDPIAKAKIEEERAKQKIERDQKRTTKKERGIMLRAKLIQLRDSADADRLLADAAQ